MHGIIVDGYSSGSELVLEFHKIGIECLHIQSTLDIPAIYQKTYMPQAYKENLIYKANLSTLLKKVKNYAPIFCIAGSEPGVELADQIANALNLANRNPIETSICRRDKFEMYKKIKKNNLKCIKQFKVTSENDLENVAKKFTSWPLVIKPLKSAGGDKVKICHSLRDLKTGFHEIISDEPNLLRLVDKEALVQEFIEAPEIAVNTVQYQGKSFLCEIVQFHKKFIENGKKIYDYGELLSFDKIDEKIINYATDVAKALEINYGPMHAEIFITKNGPLLVEAAARLMGANIPINLMKECLSRPQSVLTTLAYAQPKILEQTIKNTPLKLNKYLRIIFLISTIEGKLARINHLENIRKLESFYDIKIRIKDTIFATKDYDSSPGLIYLYHENEAILQKDYLRIRELEKNMYEVE